MSAPVMATAQTREAESQVTVQGTVEAVDQKARTVTIRLQQGNVVTLDVPPNAERFEQVKVGATVTATYYDRVSIRLKPAGEPAVDQTMEPKTTATPGASAGRHENQAAGDHGDHHRLGPRQQGRELHRTERDGLHARTAGHHRPQDRRGSQGGRSRGRHPDRSGDGLRAALRATSRRPCGTASRSRSCSGGTTSSAAR